MTKRGSNPMVKIGAFVAGASGLLALILGAAPAFARQQPSPGGSEMQPEQMGSKSQMTHVTATITAIDKSTRTVTLKNEEGEKVQIQAPQDMKNFDKLKVGDKVDVDYYESLAVAMMPPGSKPSMSERTKTMRETGGGATGKEITASAEVVSVDPAANKVTFKGPRGQIKTISVHDPDMQKKLPSLKPGQVVQFTYTEATAASIRPSASK